MLRERVWHVLRGNRPAPRDWRAGRTDVGDAWRAALAAGRRLAGGDKATDFLNGKTHSARFFANHLLPQAGAFAATALACMAMT